MSDSEANSQLSPYERLGFANRRDYLESLAEEYGVDFEEVQLVASMLGPSEDFDGLVTTLEDMEYLQS